LVELTTRENLLICLLSTIVNPKWNNERWDKQYEIFRQMQAVHAPGKFSEDEINDLVTAVKEQYEQIWGQAQYHMKSHLR